MKRIVECVPNFSEGRDLNVVWAIADRIAEVKGVKILDVDPGFDANRTVITFAGTPDAVSKASFIAVKEASELIDMTTQHGEHPRIGACDVLPFVPISGITMEETVALSRRVAKRIGTKLNIPVYCYEDSAFSALKRNLASCRAGEYEGLEDKMNDPKWKPDYGPNIFNAKSGATVVGARNFLVAFNVNLDTDSVKIAKEIAKNIRESGKIITAGNGEKIRVPGKLKNVKAIGWYMEQYKRVQVSMNLTNINVTPIHIAYNEVVELASEYGVRVTGSELVGMVPLKALTDAGKFYVNDVEIPENELINIAIERLGLDDIRPFEAHEKILEYSLMYYF
jgi:glutamate formiminotransferase/formiminotetrahydrofolate cyclodeaminase